MTLYDDMVRNILHITSSQFVDQQLLQPRRYMLQLLERPAYQRAFGAATAEQLKTVVTRG